MTKIPQKRESRLKKGEFKKPLEDVLGTLTIGGAPDPNDDDKRLATLRPVFGEEARKKLAESLKPFALRNGFVGFHAPGVFGKRERDAVRKKATEFAQTICKKKRFGVAVVFGPPLKNDKSAIWIQPSDNGEFTFFAPKF